MGARSTGNLPTEDYEMRHHVRKWAWRVMDLRSLAPRKPLFGPAVAWVVERVGDVVERWTGVFIW